MTRTLEQLADVAWRDMNTEERRAVLRAACQKLQAELASPEMRKVLEKE